MVRSGRGRQGQRVQGRPARPIWKGDRAKGEEGAAVTLVVYGDYLCPRTRGAWPVVEELREELEGALRVVWRHFPSGEARGPGFARPGSRRAAEAAEAGRAQGRFWEMHAALFEAGGVIEGACPVRYAAAKAGLDVPGFERDLAAQAHAAWVLDDLRSGLESGIRETPAFFVDGVRHGEDCYLLGVLLAAEGGRDADALAAAERERLGGRPSGGRATTGEGEPLVVGPPSDFRRDGALEAAEGGL